MGHFEGGRDAMQYREEEEGGGERGGAALLQKHPHPIRDSLPYQRGEEECGDYREFGSS